MKTLLAIYHTMPLDAWLALLGGPLASLIVAKFKKWLSLQSEKVVVFLLLLVSFIQSFAIYALQGFNQDPTVLGPMAATVTSTALFFYHTVYKPVVGIIRDAKAQRASLTSESGAVETKPADVDISTEFSA